MIDYGLNIGANGAADLVREAGDSFLNNIYLSLMIDKGSYFQDPGFGSRLYLLARAKSTAATADLARDYCREALQWMIDTGRAKGFEIETEIDRLTSTARLKLRILAHKADGQTVEFSIFKEIV